MGSIISFITDHRFVIGGLVAAIIDFAVAINPKVDSNGVIHFIYLLAQKAMGKQPPSAGT